MALLCYIQAKDNPEKGGTCGIWTQNDLKNN